MNRTAISLIGVGSLRCGPPILSTIAALRLEYPLEIRLYDANEERLDLMDRFAKRVFEQSQSHHDVLYRPNLEEAMVDANAVVVSLYDDCARRMTGSTSSMFFVSDEPEEGTKLHDIYGGDINKPTPMYQISPMTLAALSKPDAEDQTEKEALEAAMAMVIDNITEAKLLNLSMQTLIPDGSAHTALNWPEHLEAEAQITMPHKILRWLNGDPDLDDYFMQFNKNPFADWLTSDLGVR